MITCMSFSRFPIRRSAREDRAEGRRVPGYQSLAVSGILSPLLFDIHNSTSDFGPYTLISRGTTRSGLRHNRPLHHRDSLD